MSDIWYGLVSFFIETDRRIARRMKKDYVFVCLDSCRYDTFEDARAPNMKGVGKLRKAHSFSCFTPSTLLGYLLNFPPIGLNMGRLYPYRKWAWLPDEFGRDGYATAFLTANPVIPMIDISLDGVFSKSFAFHQVLKYEGKTSVEAIIDDSIQFLDSHSPVFLLLLLMETHTPIYDGQRAKIPFPVQRPSSVFSFQKRAVEFIDENMEPLFAALRGRRQPVEVTITSDHGELLGPVKWGHNPGDLTIFKRSMIDFSEALFEIPFIRGDVS